MKFLIVIPFIFFASVVFAEAEPKPKAAPKSIADPIPKADPKPSADPKPRASPKPKADPKPKAEPKSAADPQPVAEPLLAAATKRNYESERKEESIFEDITRSGLTRYGQPTLITIPVNTASKGISNSFKPLHSHHGIGNGQAFQAFQRNPFNNEHGFINAFYHPEIGNGYPTIPINVYGTPNPSLTPAFNEPIFDLFRSNEIVGSSLRIHPFGHFGHGHIQTPVNLGFFGHPGYGIPLFFDHSFNNLGGFSGYGFAGDTLGNYVGNVNHPSKSYHAPLLKQNGFVLPNQRRVMIGQFGHQQNLPVDNIASADTGRFRHENGPSLQYGLPGYNQF